MQNESKELRIYYSGHGHKESGNWITAKKAISKEGDNQISLDEVIYKI